jgi:hypothetical protein
LSVQSKRIGTVFLLLFSACQVHACVPVPYLYELFSSSSPLTFIGSFLRMNEGYGFAKGSDQAVPSIRSIDPAFFNLISLLVIIVLLKAFFIWYKVNPRSSFWEILKYQVKGNFLSTLLPFFVAIGFTIPLFIPFTLIISIYLMESPANLLTRAFFKDISFFRILWRLVLGVSPIISLVWLGAAKNALITNTPWVYWSHKCGFCTFTIATGLFLTTAIEASILWKGLSNVDSEEPEYFKKILQYNALSLLFLFVMAAAIAIPLRLSHPDFLL